MKKKTNDRTWNIDKKKEILKSRYGSWILLQNLKGLKGILVICMNKRSTYSQHLIPPNV